ncbi:MAG: transposase [Gimesia sp.]|nr:transposase [Gimesia sp.]
MRALLEELRVFGTHERLAERIGYYLARIRQLYAVEQRAKELTSEERQQLRQTESLPLLESFGRWLVKQSQRVLAKSPIGKSISNALSNWRALCRYVEDGDLAIDDNLFERTLRTHGSRAVQHDGQLQAAWH